MDDSKVRQKWHYFQKKQKIVCEHDRIFDTRQQTPHFVDLGQKKAFLPEKFGFFLIYIYLCPTKRQRL